MKLVEFEGPDQLESLIGARRRYHRLQLEENPIGRLAMMAAQEIGDSQNHEQPENAFFVLKVCRLAPNLNLYMDVREYNLDNPSEEPWQVQLLAYLDEEDDVSVVDRSLLGKIPDTGIKHYTVASATQSEFYKLMSCVTANMAFAN